MSLAAARYGQTKLARFWYFARVELRPPMPNEFGQVQEGIQQIVKSASTGAWRHLTVKVNKQSMMFYSTDDIEFILCCILAICCEHIGGFGSDVLVLYWRMYRPWKYHRLSTRP